MKEIKYRVWQNIKDKLYHAIFDLNYKSDVIIYCNEFNDFLYKDQYTGLKDKNGKEIYEGDILDLGRGCKTAQIYYDSCCAQFRSRCLCKNLLYTEQQPFTDDLNYGIYNEYEVIGNIYENPELL